MRRPWKKKIWFAIFICSKKSYFQPITAKQNLKNGIQLSVPDKFAPLNGLEGGVKFLFKLKNSWNRKNEINAKGLLETIIGTILELFVQVYSVLLFLLNILGIEINNI